MIELTVCPECEETAEVLWRSVLFSTDGPIEHAKVLCVRNHGFFLPVEFLPAMPAVPVVRVQPSLPAQDRGTAPFSSRSAEPARRLRPDRPNG